MGPRLRHLQMSISLGLMGGMLLFAMIPFMTPVDANPMHVILCIAGGLMFTFGLGVFSKTILSKSNIAV